MGRQIRKIFREKRASSFPMTIGIVLALILLLCGISEYFRLQVTLRNAPLAPSDPANAQRFEADAVVRLEVPVRFGGRLLPSMWITLKVQAGYTEVF